jgi:hypothetical protein
MHPLALEFVLLYLALGLAIGAAVALRDTALGTPVSATLAGTGAAAVVFWPLFLPFLLARRPTDCDARRKPAAPPEDGPLVRALRRTERALDGALGGIEGREALGLASVLTRMPDVMRSLEAQATSVEGMARLLATPTAAAEPDTLDPDLARELDTARAERDRRLRALHDRRREELLRAIVRLEELVAMIHLARFARERAGAGPLVQQITATVEALAELSTEENT